MPGGSATELAGLTDAARAVIEGARRAVLTTIDPRGAPVSVPICFAVRQREIVTAIDEKPKGRRDLARLRNIAANPGVCVLFDRWDENWTKLAWVRVDGAARVEEPGSADEQLALRYSQYRERPPSGDVIVITPARVVWWSFE